MKTIKGQIIASTEIDRHGEKLTKEQLKNLYDQIPEEKITGQHHDSTKKPIGKSYNKRFVTLDNGEYAIKTDIDIYDEEAFQNHGGMSISYLGQRITLDPNKKPDIEVYFNPLGYKTDDIKSFIEITNDDIQIDGRELKQKAVEPSVIMILKFASISIAAGFFGKMGSDLYDSLKNKMKKLANQRKLEKKDTMYHITYDLKVNNSKVNVLFEIAPQNLYFVDDNDYSPEYIKEYIKKSLDKTDVRKIAFRIQEEKPHLLLLYYVDSNNNVVSV
jgi:hypothetical protein